MNIAFVLQKPFGENRGRHGTCVGFTGTAGTLRQYTSLQADGNVRPPLVEEKISVSSVNSAYAPKERSGIGVVPFISLISLI